MPWLDDDDPVLGYEAGGEAFAYPINILNFHEMVNDTIGGVSLLVTYCPLCFSGVVFSREVDGQTLTFGNTNALYQSDLVMYDHQTRSYWFQVGGEAVVGTLSGARLEPLPLATMPWGEWRAPYLDTLLITGAEGGLETLLAGAAYGNGFGSGYQDRINNGQFAFPVDEDKLDGRLAAGEIGDGAVNAEVGGEAIVVFTTSGGRSVGAFFRTVEDQTLNFDYQGDGLVTDRETGSA